MDTPQKSMVVGTGSQTKQEPEPGAEFRPDSLRKEEAQVASTFGQEAENGEEK